MSNDEWLIELDRLSRANVPPTFESLIEEWVNGTVGTARP